MLSPIEKLTQRFLIALIALSLILGFGANSPIGHAEAARNTCNKVSQVAEALESQISKATFDTMKSSFTADIGDIAAVSKALSSDVAKGDCCNYLCAPAAAMPPCTVISIPHFEIADWPLYLRSLSPVPQGGLKRPPRQSGNI